MAPKKNGILCLANKALIDRLRDDENTYMESNKDRLVMTFRRAIRSVIECVVFGRSNSSSPVPIRNKRDAMKLKGVGDFIASRIEYHLKKENLLNVRPGTIYDHA
jgi:hypothetical protein